MSADFRMFKRGGHTVIRFADPLREDIVCSDVDETIVALTDLRREGLAIPESTFTRLRKKQQSIRDALSGRSSDRGQHEQ